MAQEIDLQDKKAVDDLRRWVRVEMRRAGRMERCVYGATSAIGDALLFLFHCEFGMIGKVKTFQSQMCSGVGLSVKRTLST